jgi:hypothetical protein
MTGRVRTSLTTMAAVVVAVLLPTTVTARADVFTSPDTAQGSGTSAAAPYPDGNWYGWQILGADLVSLGTLFVCLSASGRGSDGDKCALTLIPWVTGAAAIHWAGHGSPGRALVSVALHASLPIVGGYLGAASCADCSDEGNVNFLLGILMGTVLATGLDTAFSIESIPRAPAVSRRSGTTLTPTLATGGGALGLGLAGTF